MVFSVVSGKVYSDNTGTRFKRNAVVVGLKYFDVLRPKGAIGHLAIFGLIVCAWGLLNFGDKLMALVAK